MKDTVIFHIDVNSAYLSWTAVKMLEEGSDREETGKAGTALYLQNRLQQKNMELSPESQSSMPSENARIWRLFPRRGTIMKCRVNALSVC